MDNWRIFILIDNLMKTSPHQSFSPKKSLGQNFLICNWAISDIIDAAHLTRNDLVLEIGSGTGVLTKALAPRAKKIIAIEKDEKLAQNLTDNLRKEGITNVHIITGDILKDMPQFTDSYKVVANIPYYLTGRLLRLLLEECIHKPSLIAFTIQKEVAERMIALPPHENLLSISVQAYGKPAIIKNIPASCFSPKPNVDSAIITIADISDSFFIGHKIDSKDFFHIIRCAFSRKRKILANTLGNIADKHLIERILKDTNLNLLIRPQELSLDQWAYLVSRLI